MIEVHLKYNENVETGELNIFVLADGSNSILKMVKLIDDLVAKSNVYTLHG